MWRLVFLWMPAVAYAAPDISVGGSCPGTIEVTISDATPGGGLAILTAEGAGSGVVPGGPCEGAALDISGDIRLRGRPTADASGRYRVTPDVSGGACGLSVQALDLTTCEVSDVDVLPDDGGTGTGTGACAYPDVDVPDGAPSSALFTPVYVAVNFVGNHASSGWEDYTFGGEDSTSMVYFDIYDETSVVCQVIYDMNTATSIPPTSVTTIASDGVSAGGRLAEAWELNLEGGFTDCGRIDADVYGSADIREVLAYLPVVIGLGELDSLASELETAVVDSGLDWDADWAPYVYGGYVSFDGINAYETAYGFGYEAECATVSEDLAMMPAPTTSVADGYHELYSYYIFFF